MDVFCLLLQILKKGELQVGEKEREHDLSALRREIATLVAEKCVDPETQRPYPVGVIDKAMTEAGFSVKQGKTAKSQVCIFAWMVATTLMLVRCRSVSGYFRRNRSFLSNVHECGFESPCPSPTASDYARRSPKVRRRSRRMRWARMSGKWYVSNNSLHDACPSLITPPLIDHAHRPRPIPYHK